MKTLRLAAPVIVLAAVASPAPAAADEPLHEATPAELEPAEAVLEGCAAEVPFRTYFNLLLVDVAVDGGAPRPFILDTGASGTLVDEAAAEVGPEAERGAVTVRGAGGEEELALVKLDSLALGGARLLGPTVALGDLAPLRELIGADVAGVLGYDFLRHFVVKVDYENSRVTFYDAAAFAEPAGVAFIPAETSGGHPIVEMAVGGHRGRFVVDLGNPGPIILEGGYVAEHDLIAITSPKLPALMKGAGGPKVTRAFAVRMDDVTIGPYEIAGPVVVLPAEADAVQLCGADLVGNVGWEVMSRFTFYVDYPGGRLGLAPSARFDAPFDYDRTGLLLQYAGDHYVVEEVAAASPAAPLLAPGDRVVGIDGKAAAEVPLAAWARLRCQPAGTALKLTVERGDGPAEEITLELAELL
jgi:predicted aspartyl protease